MLELVFDVTITKKSLEFDTIFCLMKAFSLSEELYFGQLLSVFAKINRNPNPLI